MRYRIGLCDDEISTCSVLEKYIIDCFKEKGDNVEVFVWNSAESFIEDVPQKTCLDILFLDIELPGKNGIDVGYYIRESIVDIGMHIIFISSKDSYALELFDIHPYNFLVKPISKVKVYCEIEKLLQLDREDRRFFTYFYNKNQYKVLLGNILYFMSDKHHINIVCTDGKKEYVGKLKQELNKLPTNFAIINQSVVVNLRHIKEVLASALVMDNGDIVVISKSYRKEFNMKILEMQIEKDNI